MKNPHTWKLNWTQMMTFEGVTEAWTAEGDVFDLEVQEQDYDTVVGTIYRRIPATFWEPADYEIVKEQTYESVNEAKFLLEKFDADELASQLEWEAKLDESLAHLKYEDER